MVFAGFASGLSAIAVLVLAKVVDSIAVKGRQQWLQVCGHALVALGLTIAIVGWSFADGHAFAYILAGLVAMPGFMLMFAGKRLRKRPPLPPAEPEPEVMLDVDYAQRAHDTVRKLQNLPGSTPASRRIVRDLTELQQHLWSSPVVKQLPPSQSERIYEHNLQVLEKAVDCVTDVNNWVDDGCETPKDSHCRERLRSFDHSLNRLEAVLEAALREHRLTHGDEAASATDLAGCWHEVREVRMWLPDFAGLLATDDDDAGLEPGIYTISARTVSAPVGGPETDVVRTPAAVVRLRLMVD